MSFSLGCKFCFLIIITTLFTYIPLLNDRMFTPDLIFFFDKYDLMMPSNYAFYEHLVSAIKQLGLIYPSLPHFILEQLHAESHPSLPASMYVNHVGRSSAFHSLSGLLDICGQAWYNAFLHELFVLVQQYLT